MAASVASTPVSPAMVFMSAADMSMFSRERTISAALMHMTMVMSMSAIGVTEPAAHIALTGVIRWLIAVTVCRASIIARSSVIGRGYATA